MTKFIKTYQLENLLVPIEIVKKRCDLLEELTKETECLLPTSFQFKASTLIYEQELLSPNIKFNKNLDFKTKLILLKKFSECLDYLAEKGFVHGDIHRRNILYNGNRLFLVDLEPCFHQIRSGKKVVMSSLPRRSLNDIKNDTVTNETDKIGYFLLCHELFNLKISNLPQKELYNLRKSNNYEMLPVPEKEFLQLAFYEIYSLFNDIHQISMIYIRANFLDTHFLN